MSETYCGNNRFEIGLRRLGTPYECLKKGIGYGLHSDLSDYNPNYDPIIPAVPTYCGMGVLPEGVQQGTPASCLRKGVGVGKRLQYQRTHTSPPQPLPRSPSQPPPRSPPQPLPRSPPQPLPRSPPQPLPRSPPQPLISLSPPLIFFLKRWWPLIVAVIVFAVLMYFKVNRVETVIITLLTFTVTLLLNITYF